MAKKFMLDFLMAEAWAMDSRTLTVMGNIAGRDRATLELSESLIEAVAARNGKKITPGMEIRNGVALIHVNGVITRYAGMFEDICGGTSTQTLAKEFNQALDSPKVKGIVLVYDSGGGHAKGTHEFAEMIYKARGQKPIVSYVGGSACSAAYWSASAADKIVIDATGDVGSIGTVLSMQIRKASEDDRYETIEIVSSQSPDKRLDPTTDKGRKAYQDHLDQLSDVFIDRVARNMNVTREKVLNDFGCGFVLIGQSAVDNGMAHELGSLEGVIAELSKRKTPAMTTKTNAAAQGGSDKEITFSLPASEEVSAQVIVGALTEHRPDVLEALQESPAMAVDNAATLVQQCQEAGIPSLSASLLGDGVTLKSAESQIKMAKSLKDTLAASGLSGSYDTLAAHMSDPIKMVGQAIHEAKASSDESGDQTRAVVDKQQEEAVQLSTKDIYAKRK